MRRLATILLAVLLASMASAHARAQGLAVSLEPSPRQPPGAAPYRQARLTVRFAPADAGAPFDLVQSVSLRDALGGPEIFYPLTVPLGATAEFDVLLPATAPTQTYAVRLCGADESGADCVTLAAGVSWPLELVNPQQFIDSGLYDKWALRLPAWPGRILRNALLAAVLASLALAAALLIRRPWVRVLVVAAVVASATVTAGLVVTDADTVVVRKVQAPPADGPGDLLVIAARRDATWRTDSGLFSPVYFSLRQMHSETSLVIAPDRGASAGLDVREVRLMRRVR